MMYSAYTAVMHRSLRHSLPKSFPSRNPAFRQSRKRLYSDQPTSPNGNGKQSSRPNAEGHPNTEKKARSAHAQWYTDTVPAMIPVALLGSAVYMGLQLVQTKLANEKYLDEANARIAQLEDEIKRLLNEQDARDKAASERPKGASRKKREPSRWWWFGA